MVEMPNGLMGLVQALSELRLSQYAAMLAKSDFERCLAWEAWLAKAVGIHLENLILKASKECGASGLPKGVYEEDLMEVRRHWRSNLSLEPPPPALTDEEMKLVEWQSNAPLYREHLRRLHVCYSVVDEQGEDINALSFLPQMVRLKFLLKKRRAVSRYHDKCMINARSWGAFVRLLAYLEAYLERHAIEYASREEEAFRWLPKSKEWRRAAGKESYELDPDYAAGQAESPQELERTPSDVDSICTKGIWLIRRDPRQTITAFCAALSIARDAFYKDPRFQTLREIKQTALRSSRQGEPVNLVSTETDEGD